MHKIYVALLALCLSSATFQAASEIPLAPGTSGRFGFSGPEIFPVDQQFGQIRAADLDRDGLQDLVVVNNSRSKINLLYNLTGKKATAPVIFSGLKKELNELPPGARFRIDSVASEKRIACLLVTDLNGDSLPDLAYYGEPKELVVQYNQGTNGWASPKRWPIEDGQLTPNAMYVGDLNGDQRPDLLLLGEHHIYYLAQKADRSLDEPERIAFSGSVKAVQALDLNGDHRDDLLLVNWENANPFRFRLQSADGQLGPENYFPLAPIRSYMAEDLDGDHKAEVVTIAQNSGRAQISNFTKKPAEPLLGNLKLGQFEVLPLNKTEKSRRGMIWADLNGDRRDDLLVAEPDSGQLTIYLQQTEGGLGAPKTFPTLSGVSDVAVNDWDADGRPEIFLLSSDERQVGVTRLDAQGKIAFPTILPVDGKPLAMAAGPLTTGGKPYLVVIADQEGKRSLLLRTADGNARAQTLSESFKSNPSSLQLHDANQDGLIDLLVLIPYEKIKVLRQVPAADFEELDIAPPGGNVEQPWASAADVDGDGKPELLLGQKNFVRAVLLTADRPAGTEGKPAWSFVVKEQINGVSSSSRIQAAAPLRNGNAKIANLFLLDAERKQLTLCERDGSGTWQVARNISLPITEFTTLRPVALNGTAPNSLALLGVNTVAWLTFKGEVWEFTERDSYETPIKDGRLHDVVPGDLNNNGRKDLVFLETAKNYLDLVSFEKPARLVPADRWPVFEERTFRSRRGEVIEPREALVSDVTGDGKNDLIVIVHDRILVYPQE